jgi:heme/copper-type cytochrome/quinol oxidase subunit 2
LIGHGWAHRAVEADEGNSLARAALRFTTLSVVLSLAVNTIFALGSFIGAFNSSNQSSNIGLRFVWTYLPILITTAVVVFIILKAFVFRSGKQLADGEEKPKMSERQKALALGYAVPILCTAFAIIFGLFVYDATRTNLDTWVWVLIIAIVGFGVIAGTRFSSKARQARVEAPRPKTALAAGAATLNFVLSIVFGATVTIMSFAMGFGAIEKLRVWPVWVDGQENAPTINAPSLDWMIRDFAPAKILLLLAVVGVYLSITERHRKRDEVASN